MFANLKHLVTRIFLVCACGLILVSFQVYGDTAWDTSTPKGKTRTVAFETTEGTFMSVSPAPDGSWLVFDLLGQLYRLDLDQERAVCLTQNSGIALNFHPEVSPDGTKIAFISDRSGQDGIWISGADGTAPELVFVDPAVRFTDPTWMPDGKSLIAVRHSPTPGRGWHRRNTKLWQIPLDGGSPREIIGGTQTQYNAPSVSPDGQWLYFHQSYFSGNRFGSQSGHHLRRLNLNTGKVEILSETVTPDVVPENFQATSNDTMPMDIVSEFSPQISPDGESLLFARELPGQSIEYKGHKFTPATGLFLKNLKTGAEKFLASGTKDLSAAHGIYSYRIFPGYGWTANGKSVFFSESGKLRSLDIATGTVADIPFQARVAREISGQVRGNIVIDDDTVTSRFIQWAQSSPKNTTLVFVAFGQLWLADASNGTSKLLVRPQGDDRILTPDFSPDGKTVVYASWSDREGGRLWRYSLMDGQITLLKHSDHKYLHPFYSADGKTLLVNQGDGASPWGTPVNWELVELDPITGATEPIVALQFAQKVTVGLDGRIYYQYQREPQTVNFYPPYPAEDSLNRHVTLKSVEPDGSNQRNHIVLPATTFNFVSEGNQPQLSPDGKWLAFVAASEIFLVEVAKLAQRDGLPVLETDPNQHHAGVRRLTELGGSYPRWRNSGELEWTAGRYLQAFHIASGATQSVPIAVNTARAGGRGTIVLSGATIITMNDSEILERGDVVVENQRITCVGQCNHPRGAKLIDASGKVIMPGLVDVHAHNTMLGAFGRNWSAGKLNLAYGVTTTVDPAGSSAALFPLAEMVEAGMVTGPRTFGAAEIVIKPGLAFGDTEDVTDFETARRLVRRRVAWGAATIKNFRLTSRSANQMLIEAARQSGVSITGEGGPLYFDLGLVMDGHTGWEHTIAHLPLYTDVTRFVGLSGTVYSPTVIVAGHRGGSLAYFKQQHDFSADTKYLNLLDPVARKRYEQLKASSPPALESLAFPLQAQGLADIIRAGGRGAIGEHGEQPGLGHHWEIWSYATALTPQEALRIATIDGAWFIGLERETGSIVPGKLADLLVLNANPLGDIQNTMDIQYVMKQGILYDDDTLKQIWPVPSVP